VQLLVSRLRAVRTNIIDVAAWLEFDAVAEPAQKVPSLGAERPSPVAVLVDAVDLDEGYGFGRAVVRLGQQPETGKVRMVSTEGGFDPAQVLRTGVVHVHTPKSLFGLGKVWPNRSEAKEKLGRLLKQSGWRDAVTAGAIGRGIGGCQFRVRGGLRSSGGRELWQPAG
jgi:hypothetical protein